MKRQFAFVVAINLIVFGLAAQKGSTLAQKMPHATQQRMQVAIDTIKKGAVEARRANNKYAINPACRQSMDESEEKAIIDCEKATKQRQ